MILLGLEPYDRKLSRTVLRGVVTGNGYRLLNEKRQKCKTREDREWECGLEAKNYLTQLVNNDKVLCITVDKDRYKRLVSVCYNHYFKDINAEMVRNGYAVAYTRYSSMYITEEKQAKKEKLGIWSGKFTKPEDYRMNKKH